MFRQRPSSESGASFTEYAAATLLVAGILVVTLTAVPDRVRGSLSHAMDCLVRLGNCEADGAAEDERTMAGDDPASDPTGTPEGNDPQPEPQRVAPNEDAPPPQEGTPGEGAPENADPPESSGENEEPFEVQPVFFGGDDDPRLAPDPEAKPDTVNDWWEGLSEAEREEVMREEPENIRDLDGIPAAVRDELNREFLTDEIGRMLEEEGMTREEVLEFDLDQVRSILPNGAPDLELWEMVKLERTLNEDEEYDHHVLALDPDEGRSLVSTGNPDTADNVATVVPGTGIEWTAVNGQLGRAQNLHDAALDTDSEADNAVIAWIGYDTPGGLSSAAFPNSAKNGKDDLQDFQYGLRVTHEGDEPSNNTLIGHSYGSVVVGHAARNDSGVHVDNLALVGSPGVGGELTELNFDGGIEDIHVVLSEEDWIRDWNGFHSSDDLLGTDATYAETTDAEEECLENGGQDCEEGTQHDGYFNNPESVEMVHLGEVIANRRDD